MLLSFCSYGQNSVTNFRNECSRTHKSASTATDYDDELRKVRCALWQRIARIVRDGRVRRRRVHRESSRDIERQRLEVRDRVVRDAADRGVLQRDHRVVQARDADRVNRVPRAARVPRPKRAVVARGDGDDTPGRSDARCDGGGRGGRPAVGAPDGECDDVLPVGVCAKERIDDDWIILRTRNAKGKKERTVVGNRPGAAKHTVRAECGFVCDTRDIELVTGVRANDTRNMCPVAVALVQGIRVGVRGVGAFVLE